MKTTYASQSNPFLLSLPFSLRIPFLFHFSSHTLEQHLPTPCRQPYAPSSYQGRYLNVAASTLATAVTDEAEGSQATDSVVTASVIKTNLGTVVVAVQGAPAWHLFFMLTRMRDTTSG